MEENNGREAALIEETSGDLKKDILRHIQYFAPLPKAEWIFRIFSLFCGHPAERHPSNHCHTGVDAPAAGP
jgi:hypothetical protein